MTNRESIASDPETHSTASTPGVLQRRNVLKGLVICTAGLPFLVACGSSDNSSATKTPANSPTSPDASTPTTASNGSADVLTPVSAVTVGGGVILPSKHTVVTQPTAGTFKGFSSTCTHMGCTVGQITGGKIICPCHNSMYSIKDGSVISGPAPQPLPPISVKVDGSNIVKA